VLADIIVHLVKTPITQGEFQHKHEMLKKIISSIVLNGDTELLVLEMNGNTTRISFTKITHPEQLTSEQQADFERLSP
jgi:hypothetical protein